MFTTTGLFKSIPCPRANRSGAEKCQALNCIFSHDPDVLATLSAKQTTPAEIPPVAAGESHQEPPAKRRRLENGITRRPEVKEALQPPVKVEGKAAVRASVKPVKISEESKQDPKAAKKLTSGVAPESLNRPISPPPKPRVKAIDGGASSRLPARPKESLFPRILAHPPDSHDKRSLYLRYIHAEMKRLNGLVTSSSRPDRKALSMDEQELIQISNDEEESLAREKAAVYPNQIKRRIGVLKKMMLEEWVEHLKTNVFVDKQESTVTSRTSELNTGLSAEKERAVLREHLLTPTPKLIQMGYIMTPPSPEAIEEAQTRATQALNWEVCDRCKSRFQVFPDRRPEDGALTTNGVCVHHWGKLRRPQRKKTDAITGVKEPMYTCCGEVANTPGCSTAETHVFKIVEPAKMAMVLPFINTMENHSPRRTRSGKRALAVTFDCEMGYTVYGLELIRLTAISWPEGEEIMDILVHPRGTVLDFNSRFSGVTAETFKMAIPWQQGMKLCPERVKGQVSPSTPLPIVANPDEARKLLCSFITPATPLIGHALENDLNSIRLCHANIVDTCALYPHPAGLPIRYSLKQLALMFLKQDIQTGGEAGHDSLEDAQATGDLVRVKVGRKHIELQAKGLPV